MLTIGLVAELRHISATLKTPVEMTLKLKDARMKSPLQVHIDYGVMNLYYLGYHIWREDISSDQSMFGLESCQVIAEIIRMIDNGGNWQMLKYIEELP